MKKNSFRGKEKLEEQLDSRDSKNKCEKKQKKKDTEDEKIEEEYEDVEEKTYILEEINMPSINKKARRKKKRNITHNRRNRKVILYSDKEARKRKSIKSKWQQNYVMNFNEQEADLYIIEKK